MATQSLPVPSGLPSPTLTNPDMILPESSVRSFSPNPYVQRPPSPSSLIYSHSNQSQSTLKLAPAPQGRRVHSPQVSSPGLSTRSSASTLRKRHGMKALSNSSDDALASSPTLRDAAATIQMDNWNAPTQRSASNSSGSLHSEDLESMRWPGFDGPGHFDDSGVVLDEEEDQHDHFQTNGDGDDNAEDERWLEEQANEEDDEDEEDEDEDNPYSSAVLSRRAEIILANAKKRLNVMEGNLRGARNSLLVTPSSFNPMKMASELSQQLSAARERDRQLYGGLSAIPPRQRSYQSSPLSSASSPGHSRVWSETSIPSPFSPTSAHRLQFNTRSSSAMGATSGPWSPVDAYLGGRQQTIREVKSHEVMREHRGNGWSNEHPLRTFSRNSGSPNGLESLPEHDTPTLRRSSSTTTDLRSQMNDLKGRISSLKQKAKEDNLRRQSMQNLRTPSPFTSAEIWYAGAEAYKTSPVAADGGIGFQIGPSPVREALYEEEESDSSTPKVVPKDAYVAGKASEQAKSPDDDQETEYEDAQDDEAPASPVTNSDDDNEDNDFVSVGNDDLEPSGDSVYEDAVYEMPVAERHEDRVDAFDYEHFFLHSAMGSYSSGSRRSSTSSADSVETTRPTTAILTPLEEESTPKKSRPLHQRNASVDSVSTMATFATATEGHASDDDSDGGLTSPIEYFAQHHGAQQQHAVLQSTGVQNRWASRTPDSANEVVDHRQTNGFDSMDRPFPNPRGSSPGADLAGGLRSSKIFSILLEPTSKSERRLSLNEHEKQLVYGLAASLQQLCLNLQSTSGDQYERKEWRRRLDEARKILDGEYDDQGF